MEKESLLTMLTRHLFGRKYYANIVVSAGSFDYGISNYIFRNKEEAYRHKQALGKNRSFDYVETISFRSRNQDYKDYQHK